MTDGFDFSDRTVLVTGAASGIGAATAHWLASHGAACLVLVDRDGAGLALLDIPCRTRRFVGDSPTPRCGSGWR